MATAQQRATRIVTAIAAAVSIALCVLPPSAYFWAAYTGFASELQTKANVKAEVISQLASTYPDTWKYQEHRLVELLARVPAKLERGRATITALHSNVVLVEVGTKPVWPILRKSSAFFDSGASVGEVHVEGSVRELLLQTGTVALLGLALAALCFGPLRTIPSRALENALQQLRREKERAQVTLHSIGDAVITTDGRERIDYLNPVAEALTGWSLASARGRPLAEVFSLENEMTGEPVSSPMSIALAEKRIVPLANHTVIVRRDGTRVAIEDSAAPIIDTDGSVVGGVLVFHDVTAARSMADQLSWQASHDALTGLANRREFERRVENAIKSTQGSSRHVLCYLDLDQFKIVNDTCGHVAGDELLKQMADLIQQSVRESDTVARLGGDEFGLLLDGCSLQKAEAICDKLLDRVRAFRFNWDTRIFSIGMSAGVVEIASSRESRTDVLSAADAACYTAKEKGRGRVQVFAANDRDVTKRREEMGWVERITRAIDENRLVLYAQPWTALRGGHNEPHLEILVRLLDDTGKVVLPGAFLPAAERYNLMPDVDRWVIASAFAGLSAFRRRSGMQSIVFAINLSGASINGDFLLPFVTEQLKQHDVRPENICFEVTETVAVNQIRDAARLMKELKALGFRFALDDFGAGMSSFAYLKNLPVDYLKIDGAFVKEIVTDDVSRSMVTAITQVGHAMGLITIAECVEHKAVLAELRRIGVDFAQGYAVARPCVLEQLALGPWQAQDPIDEPCRTLAPIALSQMQVNLA